MNNVIQVKPLEDYKVLVTFEDNKKVIYNAKNLLNKGEFKKLKNKELFQKSCKVMNNTLAFDIYGNNDNTQCFDIAPDILYKLPAFV